MLLHSLNTKVKLIIQNIIVIFNHTKANNWRHSDITFKSCDPILGCNYEKFTSTCILP